MFIDCYSVSGYKGVTGSAIENHTRQFFQALGKRPVISQFMRWTLWMPVLSVWEQFLDMQSQAEHGGLTVLSSNFGIAKIARSFWVEHRWRGNCVGGVSRCLCLGPYSFVAEGWAVHEGERLGGLLEWLSQAWEWTGGCIAGGYWSSARARIERPDRHP